MKLETYNYDLPPELIAQTPLPNRSTAKLLLMDKSSGNLTETIFNQIGHYLKPGDVLVLNDSKVIPARLIGTKEETGAQIELLLLRPLKEPVWEALAKPAKRLQIGTLVTFGNEKLKAKVKAKGKDGLVQIELIYQGKLMELLNQLGQMPLPPYIHQPLTKGQQYQTVYAKNLGSVAAPTAGLHFTKQLLTDLKKQGIEIIMVTLHVGIGTFRPVQEKDITKHQMHSEFYELTSAAAQALNQAKQEQRPIYAVGTTSTRVLETIMMKYHTFKAEIGVTNLFIYPGYQFKAIDGLITNFHLPKSTLLMLVSALATKTNIFKAYQYAIKHHYRFFSFGDAMFIK